MRLKKLGVLIARVKISSTPSPTNLKPMLQIPKLNSPQKVKTKLPPLKKFKIINIIVVVKGKGGLNFKDYITNHKPRLYFKKDN